MLSMLAYLLILKSSYGFIEIELHYFLTHFLSQLSSLEPLPCFPHSQVCSIIFFTIVTHMCAKYIYDLPSPLLLMCLYGFKASYLAFDNSSELRVSLRNIQICIYTFFTFPIICFHLPPIGSFPCLK